MNYLRRFEEGEYQSPYDLIEANICRVLEDRIPFLDVKKAKNAISCLCGTSLLERVGIYQQALKNESIDELRAVLGV